MTPSKVHMHLLMHLQGLLKLHCKLHTCFAGCGSIHRPELTPGEPYKRQWAGTRAGGPARGQEGDRNGPIPVWKRDWRITAAGTCARCTCTCTNTCTDYAPARQPNTCTAGGESKHIPGWNPGRGRPDTSRPHELLLGQPARPGKWLCPVTSLLGGLVCWTANG